MIDPTKLPAPPLAACIPHSYERHGQNVSDDYFWLKDPGYPDVTDEHILDYLHRENDYFEVAMAPVRPLVDRLFDEMKGRIKEADASVPQRDGDWDYWWAFAEGAQYRRWLRRPTGTEAPAQVILDEAVEAERQDYFRLGTIEPSPDGKFAAWSADTSGAERFTLKIRDLATGRDIATISEIVRGAVVWSSTSNAVAYSEVNENWRMFRARLHELGTDSENDPILYEEDDIGFNVHLGRTQDRQWIIVAAGDHETSEIRLVPAADPLAEPMLVSPRRTKRQYDVDAAQGKLWIRTNDDHVNFRIAVASLARPADWETVIAGSDRVYIRHICAFAGHLAIEERIDGLDQIRLRSYAGDEHHIAFPEASYSASLESNPEYDPVCYRIGYSSMVTPDTIFEYDAARRHLATLKVREIPSGYDRSLYATERLMVVARDGASIPVSVVYRKDFQKDRKGPLYLYAYGAYGIAIPPSFSTDWLSLLDRGWACAVAHIRGGDDLGYGWYLDGKAERRWNSFHDFTDTAKGLVEAGFAASGRIAIQGGSAGGELMGVVVNTDPDLWGAVVADVPFVDVLNTMQDESLPLTASEWPEWGNPITDPAAFDLIRSYSPYDNVQPQAYPPMLITGGLNDPRVTYWEPAKWAAKLRATKTDDNLLLLKINMEAGHGGKSGRFTAITQRAEAYAFMIEALR